MEEFEVEENLITLKATFYDDLGLDSLDAIDLIVNLNEFYDIDVESKSAEEIRTIEDLILIIKNGIK